jgi:hypothetical protein
MTNLTDQAYNELKKISAHTGIAAETIAITQMDKSTIYFKALKFGKYEEKFTVLRTKTGAVKKGSVRFYN